MRILGFRSLTGPNVYHNRAVFVMRLDLAECIEITSADIPGFTDRLVAKLPGLHEHHCSPGHRGGFIERLRRGTYMGHIIEHVTLELSTAAGIEVHYGKTVYAGIPGHYNVIVRSLNDAGMERLLIAATRFVEALIRGEDFPLEEEIEKARAAVRTTELGPSSLAIIDAAKRRGIPWMRIGSDSLIQLGYGKNLRRVQTGVSDRTSLIAADLAQDKEATKIFLEQHMVPVPRGFNVRSEDDAVAAFFRMGAPVVVKPTDGHHGDGVTMNVRTPDDLRRAFHLARAFSSQVLVEEQFQGRDYRILLIGGKLVAAAERVPAHVVGDGVSTIQELLDRANLDPRRGEGHQKVLTRLEVDEVVEAYLAQRGLSTESIPPFDEVVFLRANANLSTGGEARDVTDEIHPSVRILCERVARLVGLDICGIDLVHPNIREPLPAMAGVIEVNAGPGLRMHQAPSHGQARDVGAAIVDMLYPSGASARIPILSITGTNGKTTTARLVSHVLEKSGQSVGLTSTDGIFIRGELVVKGDTTGPASARTVLSDPLVEVAVLETARGGILKRGLAYDWSDVGVITNIRLDHIGQDGIEDIGDLVRIKSLVAERVREGGTLILNADDFETARLMERASLQRFRRKIVYFTLDPHNAQVLRHVGKGGEAWIYRDGSLGLLRSESYTPIVTARELLFTFEGTADFQISNALAAAAACHTQGLSLGQIADGLRSFTSAGENVGRANFYKIGHGYAVVDYGHNPDAIAALGGMLRKWNGYHLTAVLGLPGDRSDEILKESARAVARHFHRVILRDDIDRRGRRPGEVPEMLCQAAKEANSQIECINILSEAEAMDTALRNLGPGQIAVLFFDDHEIAQTVLSTYKPVAVAAPERLTGSAPRELFRPQPEVATNSAARPAVRH